MRREAEGGPYLTAIPTYYKFTTWAAETLLMDAALTAGLLKWQINRQDWIFLGFLLLTNFSDFVMTTFFEIFFL